MIVFFNSFLYLFNFDDYLITHTTTTGHFWIIVLIEGYKYAKTSWAMYETGMGIFEIPLYPIKTIIPITAVLMIIQGIALFLRKAYSLKRKK